MIQGDSNRSEIWASVLLGSLLAAVSLTGIAPTYDSSTPVLSSGSSAGEAGDDLLCRSCGTVQEVRELDPAFVPHEFSTIAGGGVEAVTVLVAVLGGKLRIDPVKVREVEVRMQDGSLRILRTAAAPDYGPGDRVRVVRGEVSPSFSPDEPRGPRYAIANAVY